MKQSEFTKKTRAKFWLFRILNWACLAAPVFIYAIVALFSGTTLIGGRIVISFTFVVVIMLSILNAVAKLKLRSPVWIMLIGVYVAMKEKLLPLVIIMAVTSILSDFVFAPLEKKYADKLAASRTIDERMGDNVREDI